MKWFYIILQNTGFTKTFTLTVLTHFHSQCFTIWSLFQKVFFQPKSFVHYNLFSFPKNENLISQPSLSSQWSLVRSFIWDFFCISFVWLCSQRGVSQTKLMQKKSRTKLRTRLHWLERLGLSSKFEKCYKNQDRQSTQ